MSENRLPREMGVHLDAILEQSNFQPETLSGQAELEQIVESDACQTVKPKDWEGIGWGGAFMSKSFFVCLRFWKRGETLKTFWLGHKANHVDFVSKKYTTRFDDEDVPYSLTQNNGVCSSCADFINLVSPDSRKMFRSCPGSIVFGGAPRGSYLDVRVQKQPADAGNGVATGHSLFHCA